MRESFGGTAMMQIFVIFFVIYITIIFIALSFAKVYRVKNYVINTLEQNQYNGTTSDNNGEALSQIRSYFSKVPYGFEGVDATTCNKYADGDNNVKYSDDGLCIIEKGEDKARYYKVVVFFGIEFPFFSIKLTVPVSGETKIIYQ